MHAGKHDALNRMVNGDCVQYGITLYIDTCRLTVDWTRRLQIRRWRSCLYELRQSTGWVWSLDYRHSPNPESAAVWSGNAVYWVSGIFIFYRQQVNVRRVCFVYTWCDL